MKEKPQNPSVQIANLAHSELSISFLALAPLLDQAPIEIGQLIDRVRPADLFVIFFAQPRKPLFEQRERLLNKRLRMPILACHAFFLSGFIEWRPILPALLCN
jgi:hypothetical protein